MTRVPKARPAEGALRFGRLSATDGPYAETKEVLGGALPGTALVASRRSVARRGALRCHPIDEELPVGGSVALR
jgi:hypothetical protein